MGDPDDGDLDAFLVSRRAALCRTAFLLCGNHDDAEDLVQSTLVKVILGWRRLHRLDNPDAYARQTMVKLYIASRRRRWHGEVAHEELPERPGSDHDLDLSIAVRGVLASLPAKQRAVLVLRIWEDLSVEATATALGMREGTVRSHTSRAVAALRGRYRTDWKN
ncbi:SigE family RNA polymerase sigma factor [Streptacidiphilus monticola]